MRLKILNFCVRLRQDRTGQDRTGQDRTGQDRTRLCSAFLSSQRELKFNILKIKSRWGE